MKVYSFAGVVISVLMLAGCSGSGSSLQTNVLNNQTANYSLLEPVDAEKLLISKKVENVEVLDVRTPTEFKSGCLNGAKNIDVQANDFDSKISSLDKNKSYLVYCRAGHRSATAVAKMKAAGFTNIYEVKGGFNAWNEAKEPVSTVCK